MSADGDFHREAEGIVKDLTTIVSGFNLPTGQIVTAFALAANCMNLAEIWRDGQLFEFTGGLTSDQFDEWVDARQALTQLAADAADGGSDD